MSTGRAQPWSVWTVALPSAVEGELQKRGQVGAAPGIVLVAVILLLAILALAITTATLVAARADASAGMRANGVRARLAAESVVRAAAASSSSSSSSSWEPAPVRALRLLDERPLPARLQLAGGASGRASVRRVGPDLFLVLGNGAAGQARARAGLLVRIVSVASLLAPFPAALASGGGSVESSAHVAVLPPGAPPPGWPAAACDPAAGDTLTLVFGDAARPGVLSTGPLTVRSPDVSGSPPIAESPAQGASTGLGPLSWDMLARRADRSESGTLMLAPVAGAGGCDRAAPANWGDPHDRTSPCWSYLPLIYAPGDLHLAGGSGQGVLVVRGRLTMDAGTEFYGPILVGGGVDVATGATVWGAVASTALNWQGTANYSACALLRALGGAPGLGRPFRTGSRLWAHFF